MEMTPLAHAAGNGFKGIVKLLIDKGANVNYLCSVRRKYKIFIMYSIYMLLLPLIGYNASNWMLNTW